MLDLANATKSQLADIFRAVQEATGATISAHSTLVLLKPTDLVLKIKVACGVKLRVADYGTVVVIETAGPPPGEPTEPAHIATSPTKAVLAYSRT